jgi:hypothetical protein
LDLTERDVDVFLDWGRFLPRFLSVIDHPASRIFSLAHSSPPSPGERMREAKFRRDQYDIILPSLIGRVKNYAFLLSLKRALTKQEH